MAVRFSQWLEPALRQPLKRGALVASVLTMLGLVACSGSAPVKQTAFDNTKQAPPPPTEAEPETTATQTVEDRAFSMETLYALLVAEVALSRKRYDIALGNYVQQALSTKDLNVAAHATHIARGLNARQSALEMSQLWLDLDPGNTDAQVIASFELIEANHLIEAFDLSRIMLESGGKPVFENIAAKAEKGDIRVVNALAKEYTKLLDTYQDNTGLWLGHSILLLQSGDAEGALASAQKAKALDPNPIRSAFQETHVLHKMGKTELASKRLAQLVEDNPQNIGLRARYARLVWSSSPTAARDQFRILHKQSPADPEILLSLALVEKDLGELTSAKTHFDTLLSRNQYTSVSNYHLGDIAATTNNSDLALSHYKAVGFGQNYARAVSKLSSVLLGENRRDEALNFIQSEQQNAQGEALKDLIMIEADIHSRIGDTRAAEASLSRGLGAFPNSTTLLYARAMLYAQLDNIPAAEKDFKHVLELVPENAAALNALGYTLADQTNRYQEAYEYIKQAYALSPNDPAIIDSLGWVAYRLGNYDEAIEKLQQAMSAQPDHEIAAHLGEVLWVTGRHSEAQQAWKRGLTLNPESKIIQRTMLRLEAKVD